MSTATPASSAMAATVVPAYPADEQRARRRQDRGLRLPCRLRPPRRGVRTPLTAGSMRTSLAMIRRTSDEPKERRVRLHPRRPHHRCGLYAGIVENQPPGPCRTVAHMCVRREDGGLRYIDVWESQAVRCDATFEEYVHPAVYSTSSRNWGSYLTANPPGSRWRSSGCAFWEIGPSRPDERLDDQTERNAHDTG